jgi:DNA-binding MarR family transcriptional regulator
MASAEFNRQELVIQFWSQLQSFLDARRHAALDAGLDTAGYELLLALKAFPKDVDPNISTVGKNLMLQHRVTAKVVKRLSRQGLLSTHRGRHDRRCLAMRLTSKGQRLLDRLARKSIAALATDGVPLARSLRRLRPRPHALRGRANWRRPRLTARA